MTLWLGRDQRGGFATIRLCAHHVTLPDRSRLRCVIRGLCRMNSRYSFVFRLLPNRWAIRANRTKAEYECSRVIHSESKPPRCSLRVGQSQATTVSQSHMIDDALRSEIHRNARIHSYSWVLANGQYSCKSIVNCSARYVPGGWHDCVRRREVFICMGPNPMLDWEYACDQCGCWSS